MVISLSMLSERDVDGVVTVWRMVKHRQTRDWSGGEVTAKVTPVTGRCKISTWTLDSEKFELLM